MLGTAKKPSTGLLERRELCACSLVDTVMMAQKTMQPLHIPPNSTVELPHFCTGDGTCVRVQKETCRVVYVVFHVGPTIHSGHYQAALCVPTVQDFGFSWSYQVCNDRRLPKAASLRDQRVLDNNCYLVGLLRE